jgi:aryl-alcohol dehydrogenase-like predicted oxidoreductase
MEQRPLGTTGLTVSALGFGAGAIGGLMTRGTAADQTRAVASALAAGIRYFDTAPLYGDGRSEENLGRALRETGGWDQVVVGTKVRPTAAESADLPAAIRRSCEASLRRLRRDSVDLMQLHNGIFSDRPISGDGLTSATVLGDVIDGLRRLVEAGLVRHIGCTGMGDTDAVHAVVRSGSVATVQAYFNAANPSAGYAGVAGGGQDFAGLIDVAAASGVGVINIRPFAGGALAASDTRHPLAGDPGGAAMAGARYADDLARAQALAALAADLGLDGPLELALRFALSKAGVSTVIVGYSDQEQLEAALRWAERDALPADAVERVLALVGGQPRGGGA